MKTIYTITKVDSTEVIAAFTTRALAEASLKLSTSRLSEEAAAKVRSLYHIAPVEVKDYVDHL